jgi:hypothetical protein
MSSLKDMQTGLNNWGTYNFGNFKKRLANLRKELDKIRRGSAGKGPSAGEKKIMQRISEVLYQEKIWVKRWARVNWLKACDRNTAFFHAQVARRRRTNMITIMQHSEGTICEDATEINTKI